MIDSCTEPAIAYMKLRNAMMAATLKMAKTMVQTALAPGVGLPKLSFAVENAQ
jgi:hypothetical protein